MIGNGHAGFGRAASEKDPQGHLAAVVPRRGAIRERSCGNGHASEFATRCERGGRAIEISLRRMPGHARTRESGAATPWRGCGKVIGRRPARSPTCTERGQRPAPTRSATLERLGSRLRAVGLRPDGSRSCEHVFLLDSDGDVFAIRGTASGRPWGHRVVAGSVGGRPRGRGVRGGGLPSRARRLCRAGRE